MMRRFVFLLLLCIAVMPTASHAQDKEEAPKLFSISLGSFQNLESTGLVKGEDEVSASAWQNIDRSQIQSRLGMVPAKTSARGVTLALQALLLSSANTKLINNDIPAVLEEDLLSHKMKALIRLGAVDKALLLYDNAPLKYTHDFLAEQGIMAMLLSGQPSLACLEYQTLKERIFNGNRGFWVNVRTFCKDVVGLKLGDFTGPMEGKPAPLTTTMRQIRGNKSYRYAYSSPRELNRLAPFDLAILTAEDRIIHPKIGRASVKQFDNLPLIALTKSRAVHPYRRFVALLEAYNRGIIDAEALEAFYQKNASGSQNCEAIAALGNTWERYVAAYSCMEKAKKDEEKWGYIEETFRFFEKRSESHAALVPFAAALKKLKPKETKESDVTLATTALLYRYADKLPNHWNAKLYDTALNKTTALLQATAALLSSERISLENYLEKNHEALKLLDDKKKSLVLLSFQSLDRGNKDDTILNVKAYENLFRLTSTSNYVMPVYAVENYVRYSAESNRIADLILYASAGFLNQSPDAVYPALFKETASGFYSVGLKKEARHLAVEALLGSQILK